jgi:hypothetical protein
MPGCCKGTVVPPARRRHNCHNRKIPVALRLVHNKSPLAKDQLTLALAINPFPNTEGSPKRAEAGKPSPRPGGFGEVLDAIGDDGKPASEAEKSRQQHEWNIAADEAIRSAKACGHQPANLDRPLSESRETKQDWRTILRDFIAARTPSDYRWSPPNRCYVASGLYLPSVERSGLGTIVISVDTSGSIDEDELEQFAGEISAISDEAQPEAIHVVYCDAAVQSSQQFGPTEPIDLDPRGGGATDFRPVFEWVEENGIMPVCLIYLTDLCCHSYPPIPEYPVLWVTDSRRTAPFGETVRISLAQTRRKSHYPWTKYGGQVSVSALDKGE